MVELNWLLFCFLLLYLGQSAFSIWLDRINLLHAEKREEDATGLEGFMDASKLTSAGAYARAKTRIGIFEQITSDLTLFLVILLSGLLPLLVHFSDNRGWALIAAGLFFFFVPEFIHFLVKTSPSATIILSLSNRNSASTDPP